jgi:hypothetical protein
MDVENSSISCLSDLSPLDVVHNFSSSFAVWQGESFCSSYDLDYSNIYGDVQTLLVVAKTCSS